MRSLNKEKKNNGGGISLRILPLPILILFAIGVSYLYIKVGAIVLLLIGVPGMFAYWLWYKTFCKGRVNYIDILPIYLATLGGFMLHGIEEYIGKYSLAISRIFGFPWSENLFVIVMFVLCGILIFAAIGLYFKNPVAAFIGSLFVITRFAELGLFIFPFLHPAIQPAVSNSVSEIINGSRVENMPSYFIYTTGRYYFPGMYTISLPLIPAIIYLKKILKVLIN